MSRRDRLLDAAVVLAVVITGVTSGMVFWNTRQPPRSVEVPVRTEPAPDWQSYAEVGHRIGVTGAQVTITEFGDYECVVCRSLHKSLQYVQRLFGDSVAIVYRHFPLDNHPLGQTAARAVECAADQQSFHAYHKLLYENGSWMALGHRAFEGYAQEAGVQDSAAFSRCLFSTDAVPAITRDIEAAIRLGAEGTPTLLINDLLVHGGLDSLALAEAVRIALDDATGRVERR